MSPSSTHGTAAPTLPGYRFLEHLGSGGYSQVYLYEQDMPRRKVAVKVLNGSGLTEATRRQFTAEANAMAGLADHPNIVQVFQAALTAEGRPYLVMQYYPKPNLSVRARREHFAIADVLRIGVQIGSAVETAHRNGILHHDIKPHNILTGQFGTPALTDFGIATTKGAAGDGGLEGMSVPWSPPEVLYGSSDGDERSDVYSLGATLWHLLAGRSPFERPGGDNSTLALMRRIQSDPPPRIQRGDVPASLERLLRQAMAKDPAMRPQSALELVRGLQAVEQEQRLPLTDVVLATDDPAPSGRPAGGDDEATRVRAARRIDPQPRAAAAPPPTAAYPPAFIDGSGVRHEAPEDQATRIRGAARIDPQPGSPGPAPATRSGRHRQLPPETAPAATTARRPARLAPAAGDDTGANPRNGRGAGARDGRVEDVAPPPTRASRVIGVTVGVLLAIAAVSVIFLLPHHSSSHTGSTGSAASGGESAIAPTGPGTPTVTATRVSASKVRFRWTYVNGAQGDRFRWRRVSGVSGRATGVTAKPVLRLAVPRGQSVCITVQVVRGNQASDRSPPKCAS